MNEIPVRKMHDEDCKSVFTLNTWTEEKKQEARDLLEQGYWVHLGASCIGHTLAEYVERKGLEWVKEEYAGILRVAKREGWGDIYCQLV